jgi:hypothetical protein
MAARSVVESTSQKKRRSTSKTKHNRSRPVAAAPKKAVEPVVEEVPEPMPMVEEQSNTEKGPRFDSRMDRRIIEGMLHDRDGLMSEMKQLGLTNNAILRRAAELGLSEALIRQVKGVAADLAGERPGRRSPPPSLGARTCLCCDRVFLSAGPANRLCMRCRGGDAGLAQL